MTKENRIIAGVAGWLWSNDIKAVAEEWCGGEPLQNVRQIRCCPESVWLTVALGNDSQLRIGCKRMGGVKSSMYVDIEENNRTIVDGDHKTSDVGTTDEAIAFVKETLTKGLAKIERQKSNGGENHNRRVMVLKLFMDRLGMMKAKSDTNHHVSFGVGHRVLEV